MVLESQMKIFLFSLLGACVGFALTFAVFPLLSYIFVGTVVSDDEMNKNVGLFLFSAALFVIIGAIAGGLYMHHRIKANNANSKGR